MIYLEEINMKKLFGGILIGFSLLASLNAYSMDEGMVEMLKSMNIDKAQVSQMVDQLQQMGRITPDQAAKAKKELSGLTDGDLENYRKAAVQKIKSGDAERLINHDYTKSEPKLETPSVLEVKKDASRIPASEPADEVKPAPKIDFSKLGQ